MKRDLGQHFLISKKVLERICEYASLNENDIVYEIGAGYGNLTEEIAKRVKRVYAIEIDPKLFEMLKENLRDYKNVVFILGDALEHEIPEDCNKVMGNLPFSISSEITEKVIREMCRRKNLEMAVFMYQKEFAYKMVAKPGTKDFSRISFLIQYYSEVELLEVIPKKLFRPVPEVDAAIVRIRRKDVEWDEDLNIFVKMLFTQKKKKVSNVIPIEKEKLKKAIGESIINKRVFNLHFDEILKLKEVIKNEFPEVFQKIREKYKRLK